MNNLLHLRKLSSLFIRLSPFCQAFSIYEKKNDIYRAACQRAHYTSYRITNVNSFDFYFSSETILFIVLFWFRALENG